MGGRERARAHRIYLGERAAAQRSVLQTSPPRAATSAPTTATAPRLTLLLLLAPARGAGLRFLGFGAAGGGGREEEADKDGGAAEEVDEGGRTERTNPMATKLRGRGWAGGDPFVSGATR